METQKVRRVLAHPPDSKQRNYLPMRLRQPRDVDKTQQQAARELLAVHAERRTAVRVNDGYLTKMFYDCGIPVDEIAQSYGVGQRTVYDIIKRQTVDCHEAGQDCTTCGAVAA